MSIDEHIENLFDEPDKVLDGEKKKITLDDLNSLNIIINDSDCSNSFMNAICEDLIEKGLKFQYSNNENNFTTDHAVIISLDQQYISGPKMAILAPYKNGRNDKSDQLVLAANAAFQNVGVESVGIYCGKKGLRKTEYNSSKYDIIRDKYIQTTLTDTQKTELYNAVFKDNLERLKNNPLLLTKKELNFIMTIQI